MSSESTKNPSVLIVDDDPGVRLIISRLLSLNHYDTIDVDTAEEALELVKKRSFDLVVSDVHMPGMSGLEFLDILKEIDPAIASVIITSSDDVDMAIRAMKSGALGFITKPFEKADLLDAISSAMESARMVRENVSLKLYMPLLENASLALLNALEAKDQDSQGHSQRVAQRAVEIAHKLEFGLSADQINDIYFGALFHDIGKISIPDSILRKAGPLTPAEFKEMAEHPVVGGRILGGVKGMESAAEIIRNHHEWYNGKGYPNGLKGEEIPLGARIVAVIDAYDEITSRRVYSEEGTAKDAIQELIAGRGSQFDPFIVDILLDSLGRTRGQVALG